jgi:hypothetical protein
MNIDRINAKLKEFDDSAKQSEASRYLWKPKEGLQTVRMIPYKYDPEYPFIELAFYYNIGGKTYLAPCKFGKPDPINEFVEKLRQSGVPSQKELAKRLEAKSRTYVPIIVRGEEDKGIKFWGFGQLVLKQLMKLCSNVKMWGDIASLQEGNDLEIEFHKISKKKTKDGQIIPETSITPDPRKTPAVDVSKPELLQKIKEQPDLTKLWPLPDYNELKQALDRYLNPEQDASAEQSDTDNVDDESSIASSPSNLTKSNNDEISKGFAEFFNS